MVYFDSQCNNMDPLRYSSVSGDSGSPLLLLALGVAAYVLITSMDRQSPMACMPRPAAVASMFSSVSARLVSGRVTTAAGVVEGGEACELLDGDGSEECKTKNDKKLRQWMKAGGKGCIMIFAHWCPHCKEMMKEMVKVANENAGSGVKFLMVNAEAVASGAFTGDDAVHELKFYPTILCKVNKEVQQVSTPEEAMAVVKGDETPPQPTTVDDDAMPDDTKEDAELDLNMLF